MGLSFTVGGTKGTLKEPLAGEVAGLLDNAFGEESDWEGCAPTDFGEVIALEWSALQKRATEALGRDAIPNLLAFGTDDRGVYLPAHVQSVALPLREGRPLCCASLPGLRSELEELADRWGISLEDPALTSLLESNAETAKERLGLARIALAANEAARRDCPLWLFG